MKIEELVFKCWPGKTPVEFSEQGITTKLTEYWTCIRNTLSALQIEDQATVMSAYLYLLGYDNPKILDQNQLILSIQYPLPSSIMMEGIATVPSTFASRRTSLFDEADFIFIFYFDASQSGLQTNRKEVRVYQEDLANLFGQVLAVRFCRVYSTIKGSPKAQKVDFVFDLLENKWGIKKDQLGQLEERWNSLSDEKIEYQSSSSK